MIFNSVFIVFLLGLGCQTSKRPLLRSEEDQSDLPNLASNLAPNLQTRETFVERYCNRLMDQSVVSLKDLYPNPKQVLFHGTDPSYVKSMQKEIRYDASNREAKAFFISESKTFAKWFACRSANKKMFGEMTKPGAILILNFSKELDLSTISGREELIDSFDPEIEGDSFHGESENCSFFYANGLPSGELMELVLFSTCQKIQPISIVGVETIPAPECQTFMDEIWEKIRESGEDTWGFRELKTFC